jgi:hypothetical protein
MEINSASQPNLNLSSELRQGDAFVNGSVTGRGDSGSATINSTLGSQTDSQSATIGDPQLTLGSEQAAEGLTGQTEQLSQAAETAFASLFFSMLQNILSEAQSNSGS